MSTLIFKWTLSMEVQIPVRRRRTHTEPFKQAVINACQAPGASAAGVALAHGINANLVRRWLRERDVALPSRLPAAKSMPHRLSSSGSCHPHAPKRAPS